MLWCKEQCEEPCQESLASLFQKMVGFVGFFLLFFLHFFFSREGWNGLTPLLLLVKVSRLLLCIFILLNMTLLIFTKVFILIWTIASDSMLIMEKCCMNKVNIFFTLAKGLCFSSVQRTLSNTVHPPMQMHFYLTVPPSPVHNRLHPLILIYLGCRDEGKEEAVSSSLWLSDGLRGVILSTLTGLDVKGMIHFELASPWDKAEKEQEL